MSRTVFRSANGKRWNAQYTARGKKTHVGTFDTYEEAVAACDAVAPPRRGTRLEWIAENAAHNGDDCLRWPFSSGDWYHAVNLGDKSGKAHRVMCETAHGPAPTAKHVAMHKCDNKWCVNPMHLEWGSYSTNIRDAIDRGLTPIGEKVRHAVLTESDVRQARADRAAGMTYDRLAEKYGISKGAIWHAVKGTQWGHVK